MTPQTASGAPNAASNPGAGAEERARASAAAVDALVASEAASGKCDPDHQAALEKLFEVVEANAKRHLGEDGQALGLEVLGKRVVSLGNAPKAIEMAVTGRGTEVHVLTYAVRDVSLDVLVGNAAATTLRSPLQAPALGSSTLLELPKLDASSPIASDSRQVQMKPGQPLIIKLSGSGCAALVSFLKR